MTRTIELDGLPEREARTITPVEQAQSVNSSLSPIQAASKKLDELQSSLLPALLQSAIAVEKQKVNARRVDGRIIGTGEADFTKGNVLYTLNYKGKKFQLVDVPGIEGDERKYADAVREAVAKAHLVFYVNGTNKKPERATAEKIRSYLRYGTQVCPILNVRGNADTYEFAEDRESLECHGGATAALQQTMGVLESVLKREVLLPGHCIQGLLAFCSLAINAKCRQTSIHSSRDRDLVIQQRNYLRHFASAKAMFEFSQIELVAQVLHAKLCTFREDIIESNKTKVRELLIENIDILQKTLKEHQTFIARVEPEFEKCRESIEGAVQTFESLISAVRKNLWREFFNKLIERSDHIVAEHFGDHHHITAALQKTVQLSQHDLGESLQDQFDEHLGVLQRSVNQAMERLIQDVQRAEFQQHVTFEDGIQKSVYRPAQLNMELGLKDFGSIAFNVGSYASIGAGIGSAFPVLGTAIGAIAGAVVGAFVSVMQFAIRKEARIRKAQAKVHETFDDMRDQVMESLLDETKILMKSIRQEVKDKTLNKVDAVYSRLARPLDIIQRQIALMNNLRVQLETMPHGTIQAIRH